jgi:predicted permease
MGWRKFLRREKWDRERSDEIESYLQIETDENIERGLSYDEARAAAHRKLGNGTRIREEIYRMNTLTFLDALYRDFIYTLRGLYRTPAFTVIAVVTLTLAIGANTAVFSVVNSILLRPLPYPNPGELVTVVHSAPGAGGLLSANGGLPLSRSMYFTYSEQNRTFQALGVWTAATAAVTGRGEPEQVRTVAVSDGTLQALNVQPLLGRWLLPADQVPGSRETVILSYGYWQQRFAGDRSIVGRSIMVDSRPREILGVMPAGFRIADTPADLILPFQFDRRRSLLAGFAFQGIGRLMPGISIEQANADIARLLPIWMRSWPSVPGGESGDAMAERVYGEGWRITPALKPLQKQVVGSIGDVLWVIMGTLGVVMLIACANIANLLLVRGAGRRRELAVRSALGAGRFQIVRELLLESVLLGIVGGMFGTGLAYSALKVLVRIGPVDLPRLGEISLDMRALGFSFTMSLLSGLLFGLLPALKYAAPDISLGLRISGRTSTSSREHHRLRNLLVVAQVAMALVLLICSGLMIRTFRHLRSVDPGFSGAEQIQTLRIVIPPSLIPEPDRVTRTQNEILEKLAAIPGVKSAAFASSVPMDGAPPNWDGILTEGQTYAGGNRPPMRTFINVSPGFFQAAGTRVTAGRDFSWTDLYDLRPVVMVSENLARELWGSPASAVGKRVRTTDLAPWREVIGVAQDVHSKGVQEAAPATVYWPALLELPYLPVQLSAIRAPAFVIRSSRAGTQAFVDEVQKAVWSVNAAVPVAEVQTLQAIYVGSMARTSFTLVMLALAGSMALILGVVGIYGVISYAVSQRRREIGIRLALGARPSELKRMFVRNGLTLAAIGVAAGMIAATGVTRLMASVLFGTNYLDPMTYVSVAVFLAVAAALASYFPARRASAVDPIEVLKTE